MELWQDALKNVKVKAYQGWASSECPKDLPFHWHAHCANFNGFALLLEWNADEKLLKSTVQIFISDIQKWRRESTTRSLQTYLTRVYRTKHAWRRFRNPRNRKTLRHATWGTMTNPVNCSYNTWKTCKVECIGLNVMLSNLTNLSAQLKLNQGLIWSAVS